MAPPGGTNKVQRNMDLLETQGEAFIFGPQQITYRKRGAAQETALETRQGRKGRHSVILKFL